MIRKVFDLEQFQNFHSAVFYDIDTKEVDTFVIHSSRDDREEYIEYLLDCQSSTGLIGYNNIGYDYPLLHFILSNKKKLLSATIWDAVAMLYTEGQRIIASEYPMISSWKTKIKQLDLYRIHHFNNVAKATSLKHLQMAMHWYNLQELPFKYDHVVKDKEVKPILEYNKNDVMSTYEFYTHSKEEIQFRKRIKKSYGIDCMNYPDVKIGEEILIIENAKALGIPLKQFRQMRTKRTFIKLEKCILPIVKFKSSEFNKALEFFKSKTVHAMNTKGVLDHTVIYKGMKYDFGGGGIHGTCGSGVFRSDEKGDLILVDVSSYYPNLAIQNGFFPQHLSSTFCEVGDKLYQQRMQAKKDGDNQMVGAIKLALNGALFGKSNDEHSPMYDTKFMFDITINGQLLLCMLSERLADEGIKIIQINTDGILVKVTKDERILLDKWCKRWETLTKLKLDYDHFKVIVQRDVNNYSGTFTDNSTKEKGAFAINKPWNKDHSMKIVPIAVEKYFVDGTPVRDTIENHKQIFDFCISKKVGKQFEMEYHHIVNNKKVTDSVQRLNRFFISNTGGALIKVKDDGSIARLVAKYSITLFNKEYKSKNYNINYDYYVAEANKLVNAVDNGQIELF
tara:strand:+ start:644 stop:2503 length:1860 start_codon:yes stop_codon:yes gene_type:complete